MNIGTIAGSLMRRLYLVSNPKPEFNDAVSDVPVNLPKNRYLAIVRALFPFKTVKQVSERIVEYPFIFANLSLPKKSRVIEIGCCRSRTAVELASLGYRVTACDIKYYQYTHPNLTFVQGDLRFLDLPANYYDGATAISTIEHTGIGAYKEQLSNRGDREIVDKIYKILKPKGKFILTVPFGKKEINEHERVYNYKELLSLLRKFKILKSDFYQGLDRKYWIEVTHKELTNTSSLIKGYGQAVACVVAIK